jgi:hypothetical protein
MKYGSKYDPALSLKEIAARIKADVTAQLHGVRITCCTSRHSITSTIRSAPVALRDGDVRWTEAGKELMEKGKAIAEEFNSKDCDPQSDYCHVNFFNTVEIADPKFDKDTLAAEVERLRKEYDVRTIEDWCRESQAYSTGLPLLTQKAWWVIWRQLHDEKKVRERQPNPAVVAAFHKWIGGDLQFDEGPVYWRVYQRDEKKPFAWVRKSDGAIFPPRGSSGQPNTKAGRVKYVTGAAP